MNEHLVLHEPHLSKAILWIRALRRRTIDYWYATTEDPGSALLEAALATVAANVIDETVFENAHEDSYRVRRRSHPQGRVVMGLELIRNCEVHAVDAIEPTVTAVFGVPGLGYRQVYAWPSFEALPLEYRQQQDGEPRARGEARDAYRKWVAGRPVSETLLDAIAFFESLDKRLCPLTALDLEYSFVPDMPLGRGKELFMCRPMGLDQFQLLLPDLACRSTERRSPSWIPADQWLAEQDRAIRKRQPAGTCREVCGRVIDGSGSLVGYRGLTGRKDQHYRDSWVERASQVGRDIRMGYRYFVLLGDAEVDVASDQQLRVSAHYQSIDLLKELDSTDSPTSLDHMTLNESNPDLYRRERLAG